MDLCELREFENGPRHPWEMTRLSLIEAVLRSQSPAGKRLLEVGCGDGFVVRELVNDLALQDAVAVDPFLTDDLLVAMNEQAEDVRFVRDMPTGEQFEFVTMLDVLEHVEDDRALLHDAVARLRPDGMVMITVPAHPKLFCSHDTFMRHYRRYSSDAFDALLADCGLEPQRSGYLFGSLMGVRCLEKLAEKLFGEPTAPKGLAGWGGGAFLGRLVAFVLTLEGRCMMALSRLGIRLPGLSLWALCRQK